MRSLLPWRNKEKAPPVLTIEKAREEFLDHLSGIHGLLERVSSDQSLVLQSQTLGTKVLEMLVPELHRYYEAAKELSDFFQLPEAGGVQENVLQWKVVELDLDEARDKTQIGANGYGFIVEKFDGSDCKLYLNRLDLPPVDLIDVKSWPHIIERAWVSHTAQPGKKLRIRFSLDKRALFFIHPERTVVAVAQSGTWSVAIGSINQLPVSLTTAGNLKVALVESTVTQNVSVTNTVTVTGAVTVSGTVSISGAVTVNLGSAIPAGDNTIGRVKITDGTDLANVTGTSLDVNVTNAISVTGTVTVAGSGNFIAVGTDADNAINSTAKLPVLSARANGSAPAWTEGHEVPMSVDLSGRQRVLADQNGSWTVAISGTVTVSGTVNAAQSGTWDINSVTSITNTVTVQLTGGAADNSSNSTNKTPVLAARANAAAPTWTEGAQVPISTDLAGSQRVIVTNTVTVGTHAVTQSGTWNIGTVTSITNTVTVDTELPAAATLADATTNPSTTSVGSLALLYNGATWDRMRGDITNGLDVDVTRVTGTVTISGAVTQSGTWNVSTVTTLTSITNNVNVVKTPSAASGALSLFRNTALSNTAVAVKASAGRIHYIHFYNPGTADAFVQFYDVAQGSVVVGTTTPNFTWAVPAGGVLDGALPDPLPGSTALTLAATNTVTGGAAPGTALLAEVSYI